MDKGGGWVGQCGLAKGGMRMRVDEGSCYKMWIRIVVLYVRPFIVSLPIVKKLKKEWLQVSRFG